MFLFLKTEDKASALIFMLVLQPQSHFQARKFLLELKFILEGSMLSTNSIRYPLLLDLHLFSGYGL